MGSLRRTAVGDFRLEDALTLEELRGTDLETIEKKLIPLADVFVRYPAVTLPAFQGKLYANGEKIFLSRLPSSMVSSWKEGDRFRIFLPFFEGLHSLADVVPSDEGLKLRSFIRFG